MSVGALSEIWERWGRGEISDAEAMREAQRHLPNRERAKHARYRARPKKMERPEPRPSLNYARAGAALTDHPGMSDSARRLVQWVIRTARGRGHCTGYVAQIADALQLSHRTVQYAISRAVALGFLTVNYRRSGSINDASEFYPTAKALPPPPPARRRQRRPHRGESMGVQNTAPHDGGATHPHPLTPSQAGQGEEKRRRAGRATSAPSMRRGAPPGDIAADTATACSPGGAVANFVPFARPPPSG